MKKIKDDIEELYICDQAYKKINGCKKLCMHYKVHNIKFKIEDCRISVKCMESDNNVKCIPYKPIIIKLPKNLFEI